MSPVEIGVDLVLLRLGPLALRWYGLGLVAGVLAAPWLALGIAIGCVGATIAGDPWGAPTGGGWGLVYRHPDAALPHALLGVPTQPLPLYELTLALVLCALLWALKPAPLPAGS